MNIHPAIYRQPSEVLLGDPREDFLLVGNWTEGFTDLRQKRLEAALDRIIPLICWSRQMKQMERGE